MEAENQFYVAAAELGNRMGIDGKVLVAGLREIIRGKIVMSMVVEPPMTVGCSTVVEQSSNEDIVAKRGFLADDSWIHALTTREQKLLEPKVMEVVGKLLKMKGQVNYPKERGRAAKGPHSWMKKTLVMPSGPLTVEELELIPQWVFRRFDERLYVALHNANRNSKE